MKWLFLFLILIVPSQVYAERLFIVAWPDAVMSVSGVTLPNAVAIETRINDKSLRTTGIFKQLVKVGGGRKYYKESNPHRYWDAYIFRRGQLPYTKAQIDNFFQRVKDDLTYWSSGIPGEGTQLPVVIKWVWTDSLEELKEDTGWSDVTD